MGAELSKQELEGLAKAERVQRDQIDAMTAKYKVQALPDQTAIMCALREEATAAMKAEIKAEIKAEQWAREAAKTKSSTPRSKSATPDVKGKKDDAVLLIQQQNGVMSTTEGVKGSRKIGAGRYVPGTIGARNLKKDDGPRHSLDTTKDAKGGEEAEAGRAKKPGTTTTEDTKGNHKARAKQREGGRAQRKEMGPSNGLKRKSSTLDVGAGKNSTVYDLGSSDDDEVTMVDYGAWNARKERLQK